MLFSLSTFSQTDTKIQQVSNTDTVKISIIVAKKITKDLLEYDVLKQEKVLLKQNIDTLIYQRNLKDSIIVRKDDQINLYKSNVESYKSKEIIYKDAINKLDLQVTKYKLKSKLGFVSLGLMAAFTILHK
jgi:hypothetical protein